MAMSSPASLSVAALTFFWSGVRGEAAGWREVATNREMRIADGMARG
jgi:hypothetical protein